MIFAAIGICKKWEKKKKRKEKKHKQSNGQKTKHQCDLPFCTPAPFCVLPYWYTIVNSTVNEWSDSVVVCATSCEVTQTGKCCKHTRMLCKHFFAWVRAKSRGFAPVSCVYCKPGFMSAASSQSTSMPPTKNTHLLMGPLSTGVGLAGLAVLGCSGRVASDGMTRGFKGFRRRTWCQGLVSSSDDLEGMASTSARAALGVSLVSLVDLVRHQLISLRRLVSNSSSYSNL